MLRAKIILVDLDGTLCEGECWSPEECLRVKPLQKNIEKVNKLAKGNFIVIWTARRDHLIEASIKWLRRNGVMFDAISNNKAPADCYIDDKMFSFEDALKGGG